MGMLINGEWISKSKIPPEMKGKFPRNASAFRDWITKDGHNGFKAESKRYHLYASYACPWASRTLIFRILKGLEEVIDVSIVKPVMSDYGWEFSLTDADMQDSLYHSQYVYEIYTRSNPNYTGRITMPLMWDKKENRIVNNDSGDIMRMLNSEFNDYTKNQYDYYPVELRTQIDNLNDFIYENINDGVYQCGFANSKEDYEAAYNNLFLALDELENRLSEQRYLHGDQLTESDWRLFTTLIRFDMVYFSHLKCNKKRIQDYLNLSNYLRDLYQIPGIKQTVNIKHIKEHYYLSHKNIHETPIMPSSSDFSLDAPHNRG